MKELKTVAINVLSNSIYALIFYVVSIIFAALIPIISAIIIFIQGEAQSVPLWIWIILVIFVIISIISIILSIAILAKRKNQPKPQIKYEKLKIELFFEDRVNIKCIRDLNFTVMCEKMKHLRKEFVWTGTGYKGTYIDDEFKDKYSIDWSGRVFPPQIYDVIFEEEKVKGDEVHYIVRHEVTDENQEMIPRLTQHIVDPVKMLELIVTVPKGMIKRVYFVEYVDPSGNVVIGNKVPIEVKHVGNLDVFEYQKCNPELLHSYKIEWEFDK
ncbi:MAG: hypothetical protein K2K46_09525 [Lachnospiraceae bacterium]|nr:hypothetical protein [Lachnospiraceae bacterium]